MVNLLHQQVVGIMDLTVTLSQSAMNGTTTMARTLGMNPILTQEPQEALLCWKRVQRHLLECKTLEIPDLMDSAILPIVSYTSRKI